MLTSGFCTYIATNKRNGTLYTGHTDDIGMRGLQHLHGTFDGFSKRYGCRHIVWFEEHVSRDEAFVRERRIKEWRRSWKLELIERFNPHWIDVLASPVWPLPDAQVFPEFYERCLTFALPR
ncbi:GIY-YIG nuclease family protein [uncultured Algimonas sp.]|uniref:GIY-YIG nuclease family protein n=1 Tax=uncultured Algimonas sp. TaxID=1547920 RepID=UPI0026176154|nr:GIY-YIG nuclease family protein [uncultured Algimonas sp.]